MGIMPNSPIIVDESVVSHSNGAAVATAIPHGRHRMTVGLRPLALEEWIDLDTDHDAQLQARAALLRERNDVLAGLPGSHAAQREVLDLLIEHLRVHFDDRYTLSAPAAPPRVTINSTGQTVSLEGGFKYRDSDSDRNDESTAPLRMAAHLVPEDLCLLQDGDDGRLRMSAAALCFPTRWKLADKLGQPLLDIHAPVPGYAREVGTASDRVMDSLDPARLLWRQNWSLLDSPALYQPVRIELPEPLRADSLGRQLWMRSERQTLRRLPRTGAVLFTIRIRQCTLDTLCREPGAAERLLTQVQTMPAALKTYKGLSRIETMLCAYLHAASRVNICD